MNHKKIAVCIFLIAFAFGLNITGIMPVLGILNQMYAAKGTSAVQLLQTLPYGLLIVGSMMIGWLTTRFSKKNIAAVGLFLIGLCGILPCISDSYTVLLLSRILIGFGFGITSPLNTAIVAEIFPPQERAGYLGLHVVGMGVGGMLGNVLGGTLASLGYRYFYLVYITGFIACAGILVLLPHSTPVKTSNQKKVKLNNKVYVLSGASFVHTLFITAYNTNIAIYVLEQISTNTAVTGIVTAVNAAFAMIVGALFAKISGICKKYTLPLSIFVAAVGYAAILWIPGTIGVYVGSACCGASLSCFMAQCSYLISVSMKPEAVAKASGVFAVVGGVGGLISPVLIGPIVKTVMGSNTAVNQFLLSCFGMAVLAAVTLLAVSKSKQEAALTPSESPR